MVENISVIIPSNHDPIALLRVVEAICLQTVKPAEIIIVDSYNGEKKCPVDISEACAKSELELIYLYRQNALPGQARNIGLVHSNMPIVAFIDVQTIPHPNWIDASLRLLASDHVMAVWGSTHFCADTSFERLVRDSFYGAISCKTLPGSLFRRDTFATAGLLIDWVRAGEDTEWMRRLDMLRLKAVSSNKALVYYEGLRGLTLTTLLKKWYRNYSACRNLPQFFPQKILIWIVLYPLIILLAFNWNYLIAEWRMESPLYIGHITKMAAILPPVVYILARGVIFPIRRGVYFSSLFPFRFIAISILCFLADAVKVFAFTLPKD